MGAWKQFTTKDVTQTPFTADKGWNLTGSVMTGSDYGVNFFQGNNVDYLAYNNYSTGFVFTSSYNSVYNSAKQLYYTNYRTSSTGDYLTTASVIRGVTREDDRLTGPIQSPLYDNYLQSSLTQQRNLRSRCSIISIPTKLFGEKIMPYTFELNYTGSYGISGIRQLVDDGEGNVIDPTITPIPGKVTNIMGQIFYSQGMVVLTDSDWDTFSTIVAESESGFKELINVGINFSSSLTIHENQYKCTILENEFGVSTNPSLLSSSFEGDLNYYSWATASYFEPYVTCVGLYNEAQQLVAVGKLSFPLPVSKFTDTTVIVNYDI